MSPPPPPSAAKAACLDALAALEAGDVRRAEAILAAALAGAPSDPNLHYLRGNCALVRGDDDLALERYGRALAAAPAFPAVLLNVGFIHRRAQRLGDARMAFERCVALAPDDEVAWANLVSTYVNEGEPACGEAVARRALVRHPTSAMLRWNLSLLLLEQGRWEEGFEAYRHRFAAGAVPAPRYGAGPQPPRLESLADLRAGDRVVCHGEQGLGDEILFAGMAAECAEAVAARGATLLLDPSPRLRRAFERSFAAARLWPDGAAPGRPDWLLGIGDLGRFFRRRDGDFPDRAGYLRTDASRVAAIRAELRARAGGRRPLVGIAWTGGSDLTHRRYRCIALREWLPLLRLPATFVALEYRDCATETRALAAAHGVEVLHLPALAAADDYDDVLHLVAALDRVVTVPTSVLHAAGAVGTPCDVVMHHRAAWRESAPGARIPWYPRTHARHVRGGDGGGWEDAVAAVAGGVAAWLASVQGPSDAADRAAAPVPRADPPG